LFAQFPTSLASTEPVLMFLIITAIAASGVTAIFMVNRRRTKRNLMEKKFE
jgi:hypothetical protein